MKLARNVLFSLEILAAHKLRTALSMAGIVAGVAAVVVMVSAGRGAEERILGRIRSMGTSLLVVNAAAARSVGGRERQSAAATALVPSDARAVAEECPAVARTAPGVHRPFPLKWESRTAITNVVGLPPEGLGIRDVRAGAGRLYDDEDERLKRRVALIGTTVVERLFRTSDPVGQQILVGRVPFEVIGVTARKGIDAQGTDQDDVLFIPLGTAMRRLLNVNHVQSIFVQAAGEALLGRAEAQVRALLRERRRVQARGDAFTIQNQATLIETERAAARSMTFLIGGVAAIALLVGGVGVLAVMLISVRERRGEIGLRRAVGARRRDIALQFLIEAGFLAGVGGLLGVGAGVGAARAASALASWPVIFSWPAAAGALGFSLAVGVFFGIHPAIRAAWLEPVRALRSE